MRFRSRGHDAARREPRAEAFRSADLVRIVRNELSPWLKTQGFKRLGGNAWIRPHEENLLIVEVQCRQGGWDPRSGSAFVVEFELTRSPERFTGFSRERLWGLLDELRRQEVIRANSQIAWSLPPPDQRLLAELPASVRDYYLSLFAPTTETLDSTDVWFAYYDEADAMMWAGLIARSIDAALQEFLTRPPSFFGFDKASPDQS